MKDQKGITLVALIVIIVVMVILTAVSVNVGMESLNDTRLQGFYTQLEIIQKRVDAIASMNEHYVDNNGNKIYLKEQGQTLTISQQNSLQSILQKQGIDISTNFFRYFTISDLESKLDLLEMEYNVFIDFTNRVIVAEDGVKVGNKTYYVLESTTHFIPQNATDKNVGMIKSLNYQVTAYGEKYKIVVTPSNTVGDLGGKGYVRYKKTTVNYWEVSNNTEMIVEPNVEYNVKYEDNNRNSIEKIVIVVLSGSTPTVVQK